MTIEQLVFDLPHRPALGAEDFVVSECNRAAVRLIDAWPEWSDCVQLLVGPAASGKTHLARVWQALAAARPLAANEIELPALGSIGECRALIVEDIDRQAYDEQALFHLLNLARENRLFLILTARLMPSGLDVRLPDLHSRLAALPAVGIGKPDDALIKAMLLKHFDDRQLDVDPKVVDFIALRIDRSFAAVQAAVEAIDRAALATGRRISRQLAAKALEIGA